ncbi:hypothetical protein EIL50_03070 [bacterium NHP-B]|nr:hypothetical protein EIL50_03070 [bacterium NHP-B]
MKNRMKAPLTALLAFVLSTASFHTLEAYAGFGTQDYLDAKRAKGHKRSNRAARYAPYPAAAARAVLAARRVHPVSRSRPAAAGPLHQEDEHRIVPHGPMTGPPRRPHRATGAPTPERGATSSVNTRPRAQRALTFGSPGPALEDSATAARIGHQAAMEAQAQRHQEAMDRGQAYVEEMAREHQEDVKELRAYIQQLRHEKEEQARGKAISEATLRTYDQKWEELQAAYKKRLENANAREQALIKKHLLTNKEKRRLDEDNDKLQAELAKARVALAKVKKEHERLKEDHAEVVRIQGETNEDLEEANKTIEALKAENERLHGEHNRTKAAAYQRTEELKAEIDRIGDEKEEMQKLMKQKNDAHSDAAKKDAAKIAELEAKLKQQDAQLKQQEEEAKEALNKEHAAHAKTQAELKETENMRDAALSNADEIEDAVGSGLNHLEERAGKAHAKAQKMMKKSAHNAQIT